MVLNLSEGTKVLCYPNNVGEFVAFVVCHNRPTANAREINGRYHPGVLQTNVARALDAKKGAGASSRLPLILQLWWVFCPPVIAFSPPDKFGDSVSFMCSTGICIHNPLAVRHSTGAQPRLQLFRTEPKAVRGKLGRVGSWGNKQFGRRLRNRTAGGWNYAHRSCDSGVVF